MDPEKQFCIQPTKPCDTWIVFGMHVDITKKFRLVLASAILDINTFFSFQM